MSSTTQPRQHARPRFSIAAWFYLVTFYVLLGFLPIILTSKMDSTTAPSWLWITSSFWPVMVGILWLYANRQCSSDRLRFNDGLLWVTGSMMAGWLYLSFLFVLPVLLFAFTFSVFVAIYGGMRRSPEYSQAQWQRLVRFFYRNRMRQK